MYSPGPGTSLASKIGFLSGDLNALVPIDPKNYDLFLNLYYPGPRSDPIDSCLNLG